MECRKIREMLMTYFEGIASPQERKLVEEHILSCHGCSNALENLKRTKELIKGLPEVEPPPWLQQRVMARIRSEEEAKKSLFRKLFYPLHIKVPIEGFATVLIAGVALVVFRAVEPEIKTSQAPSTPRVVAKGGVSKGAPQEDLKAKADLPAPRHEVPVRGLSQGERIKEEAGSPSTGHEILTKESPLPRGGEGATAERVQEEAVAPKQKDEMAAGSEMRRDVQRRALSVPAPRLGAARKRTEAIGVTVRVKDVRTAMGEIENLLVRLGATRIGREFTENGGMITAAFQAERLNDLLEQLKTVGEIKEKDTVTDVGPGIDEIRIEIISQ